MFLCRYINHILCDFFSRLTRTIEIEIPILKITCNFVLKRKEHTIVNRTRHTAQNIQKKKKNSIDLTRLDNIKSVYCCEHLLKRWNEFKHTKNKMCFVPLAFEVFFFFLLSFLFFFCVLVCSFFRRKKIDTVPWFRFDLNRAETFLNHLTYWKMHKAKELCIFKLKNNAYKIEILLTIEIAIFYRNCIEWMSKRPSITHFHAHQIEIEMEI